MIELTPAAARQILISAHSHGDTGSDTERSLDRDDEIALRVAAWPTADGSIEYGMGFDEEREGDLALCVEGVDLLIGAPSRAFLIGTVLDYVEYQPGDFRFIFIPPVPEQASTPPAGCGGGSCGGGCSGTR